MTVVERGPAVRDGGQNVVVRGVGREVFRRMGVERAALDAGTGDEGTAWIATAAKVDRLAVAPATPFVASLGFATLVAGRIRRDNPGQDGNRGR